MNSIQKLIAHVDNLQRKYRLTGFTYGVVKKFGDDQAGYQAALLTYYGFLSLFPLLLVLTTLTSMLAGSYPHLQATITDSVSSYFPVLGNQLSNHAHGLNKSGLALFTGILFTLYGARGVADAFQHGVNHIWRVPVEQRDGFPKAQLKSLGIILIGGFGLILASASTGFAAAAGHGPLFSVLSILVNVIILFWLITLVLNISLPSNVSIKQLRSGAAVAAIGLVILQFLGGYLLTKQLKNLDALYSNFAVPLGLLFWIYLQAQVFYYAVEVSSVKAGGLWPRSLSGKRLTVADKKAYAQLAKKEQAVPEEGIETSFKKKN